MTWSVDESDGSLGVFAIAIAKIEWLADQHNGCRRR
jgi:hypothetical protein